MLGRNWFKVADICYRYIQLDTLDTFSLLALPGTPGGFLLMSAVRVALQVSRRAALGSVPSGLQRKSPASARGRDSSTTVACLVSVRLLRRSKSRPMSPGTVFACSGLSRQVAPPGSETPPQKGSNGEQPQGAPASANTGALLFFAMYRLRAVG